MSYQEERLQEIADAIRVKKGTTDKIIANNFATEILNLSTGSGGYDIEQTIVDGGCELHITDGGTGDKMYYCKVIDYDGTVLKDGWYYAGQEFELPAFPTHDKLVAQEWSATSPIVNNKIVVSGDVMAGVIYTTKSGLTEFDFVVNKATGTTITLNISGTKNWGDGTSDALDTHTYANYGEYTVSCSASEIITNKADDYTGILLADAGNVVAIRCGNNVTKIGDLDYLHDLKYVTLSNSVREVVNTYGEASAIYSDKYAIKNIILPIGITQIQGDIDAEEIVIPYGVTKSAQINTYNGLIIPTTVQEISISVIEGNVYIPDSVTKINYLYLGTKITQINFPSNLQTLGYLSVQGIERLVIPNTITTLGVIISCEVLKEVVIPNSVTQLTWSSTNSMFNNCRRLDKVDFSENIQSIKTLTVSYADAIFDFSKCKQVPSINKITVTRSPLAKFVVPDNLYEQWIVADTWSGRTNYIYKASEVTL